jgi:tetratricopeptide (TPR) repeat protein
MAKLAGLHAMHGESETARRYASNALQVNPRNVEALYAIGTTLLSAEQRLENAEEMLAIAPLYYPAVRHKALALHAMGRSEEALRCVRSHIHALRDSTTLKEDELSAAKELLRIVASPLARAAMKKKPVTEREAREAELRKAEQPLMGDLAKVGVSVGSVYDLVNTRASYPEAPVLLQHCSTVVQRE